MSETFRLVTRSDFDGLVCAVLFRELKLIDEILFVHPKEMQDRTVEITARDITTNLPYVPGCYLAFDHHTSEAIVHAGDRARNHVLDPTADSAARVVYDYYGGTARFPGISEELMAAVDLGDSARFTLEEVLDPQGWVLLNFLMDSRTGLGRFRQFRISNYKLMMELIDHCRFLGVVEVLALDDVRQRVELYRSCDAQAKEQIHRCSTVHGNLVVLDLRREETIYPTNRFMIYALFPNCNISMHVMWGKQQLNTVFALGASIFNRTCATNIGELCLKHNGGGHAVAGTCQVDNREADAVLERLIDQVTGDDETPMLEVSAVEADSVAFE